MECTLVPFLLENKLLLVKCFNAKFSKIEIKLECTLMQSLPNTFSSFRAGNSSVCVLSVQKCLFYAKFSKSTHKAGGMGGGSVCATFLSCPPTNTYLCSVQ